MEPRERKAREAEEKAPDAVFDVHGRNAVLVTEQGRARQRLGRHGQVHDREAHEHDAENHGGNTDESIISHTPESTSTRRAEEPPP